MYAGGAAGCILIGHAGGRAGREVPGPFGRGRLARAAPYGPPGDKSGTGAPLRVVRQFEIGWG